MKMTPELAFEAITAMDEFDTVVMWDSKPGMARHKRIYMRKATVNVGFVSVYPDGRYFVSMSRRAGAVTQALAEALTP